jgi:hypothetical protein
MRETTVLGARRGTAAIENVTSGSLLYITKIQRTSKALAREGAHMVQTFCVES